MTESGKETPQFTYLWSIQNSINSSSSIPFHLESPTFTVRTMESTKWNLYFVLIYGGSVAIRISRKIEDDGPDHLEIKFELAILDSDGFPLVKKVNVKKFWKYDGSEFFKITDPNEIFIKRKATFLPNDTLTIRCQMWRIGTEITTPETCFARTVLRINRRTFDWAVTEFSKMVARREHIVNLTPHSQLTFILDVKEGGDYDRKYIAIFLKGMSKLCMIKLCLLDFERNVVKSEENFFDADYRHSFFEFFEKNRLMEEKDSLLPNDVLTLSFEIQMTPVTVWSRILNYRDSNSTSSSMIATDKEDIFIQKKDGTSNVSSSFTDAMASLLVEGTFGDVNVEVGSKVFLAHKCILSARSPVFKAIFSGDMETKARKYIIFHNTDGDMIAELLFLHIDEDTIVKLLSYIYTDSVGDLQWEGAVELYEIADDFELLDLKEICSNFLQSNVQVSNVCSALVLGDKYDDQELQEKAQDFIRKQDKDFFRSETWKNFKEENPELALETMEQIASTIKSYF